MLALVRKIFSFLLLFLCHYSFSQTYTLNGSATQISCNCYTLTNEASLFQGGSVWNASKLDLRQPFDFKFNVFLGCNDFNGADGSAFILQTQPNSIGRNGSGLGFADVTPSVAIALDTYQNTVAGTVIDDLSDPYFDHISIQANGIVRHGNDLAEPVPASATSDNIEDCNWHVLRITWNPATSLLQAYFDGVLRVQSQVDLVNAIFRSNPLVYWGFSAATGGAVNVQKFCTALNPDFSTSFENNGTCIGKPLSFYDQSLSFAPISGYYWEFGDGATSTANNPPAHMYAAPGVYTARLAITALDGCKSDTLKKQITIGSVPNAAFTVADACFKKMPQISFGAANIGSSYKWLLDGNEVGTGERPDGILPVGSHTLERKVVSDFGCGSDAAAQPLTIKPVPVVEAKVSGDQCIGVATQFLAQQQDAGTVIQGWAWNFGDVQRSAVQNPFHAYKRAGSYTSSVWAVATNGCLSDTVSKTITVHEAFAKAGKDTIVLNSVPFHLAGAGEGTIKWYPPAGLDRDDILNPVGMLTNDQRYELTVTTAAGCVAKDTVFIEVFKGSAIYVPTAFTPDGNGRNDLLTPRYTGIKKLSYFTIYNRWGERLFTTANLAAGWDGRQGGKAVGTGSFVWMLRAEDIAGKVYNLKGTFTLIR